MLTPIAAMIRRHSGPNARRRRTVMKTRNIRYAAGLSAAILTSAAFAVGNSTGSTSPSPAIPGKVVATMVQTPVDPNNQAIAVFEDLGTLGLGALELLDDGLNGDLKADDGIFTAQFELPISTAPGGYPIAFKVLTRDGVYSDGSFIIKVGEAPCSADFNGDGDVGTDADIVAFFSCIGGDCCRTCGSADFNGDGDVGTDADIEAFFSVLAGGAC
jgi:hypothetical protein